MLSCSIVGPEKRTSVASRTARLSRRGVTTRASEPSARFHFVEHPAKARDERPAAAEAAKPAAAGRADERARTVERQRRHVATESVPLPILIQILFNV